MKKPPRLRLCTCGRRLHTNNPTGRCHECRRVAALAACPRPHVGQCFQQPPGHAERMAHYARRAEAQLPLFD